MIVFPPDFDYQADGAGVLHLAELDTPDGAFGFLLGIDGKFVSTDARVWWGSQLIRGSDMPVSIGGTAPEGQLTLSWFQAEGGPDTVAQVRALGTDYIRDRAIRFYVQPIAATEDFQAPRWAPILFRTARMTTVETSLDGPLRREMTLSFESALTGRNTARGFKYTTTDHATLTGAPNPSLQYMPSDGRTEESLFG